MNAHCPSLNSRVFIPFFQNKLTEDDEIEHFVKSTSSKSGQFWAISTTVTSVSCLKLHSLSCGVY